MTYKRKLFVVLAGVFGMLAPLAVSTVDQVTNAKPAAAAAPSYCAGYASGWFPYIHAPWFNVSGPDRLDSWVTCVPPGTSVPWYDQGLSPYCGVDQIEIWRFWYTPESGYTQKGWLLYGVNYQNGASIPNWGNSVFASHQWSGYTSSTHWLTWVHTTCGGWATTNGPAVTGNGWAQTAWNWTRP